MVARHTTLLEDAQRQVQIADHLLTMTYPLVKDPKLLVSVAEHLRRSIEDAADAIVQFHIARAEYELPAVVIAGHSAGHYDILGAFSDLLHVRKPQIAESTQAIALCRELASVLQHYKEAPVSFPRDEKLVIADHEYALREITPLALKEQLTTTKKFVHASAKHVMLAGEALR